jgi:hypothetical protein
MFYYQEIGVKVNGGFTRQNMPFTFGYPNTMAKGDDD